MSIHWLQRERECTSVSSEWSHRQIDTDFISCMCVPSPPEGTPPYTQQCFFFLLLKTTIIIIIKPTTLWLIVRVNVTVSSDRPELFALLIFTQLDLGQNSRSSPPAFVSFLLLLLLIADTVFFPVAEAGRLQLTPALRFLVTSITDTKKKENIWTFGLFSQP